MGYRNKLLELENCFESRYTHFLNHSMREYKVRAVERGVIHESRNKRGSDCIWSISTTLAVDIAKYSQPAVTH